MPQYFRLRRADSEQLLARNTVEDAYEISLCPATSGPGQHREGRRVKDLALEVKHNRRDQWLISTLFEGMVCHARLLEEFEKRGLTGYRNRPATVRFRDGSVSNDYSELVITGWAGMASPESGIELIEACTACGDKRYSGIQQPEKLIDWSQWTGEDFFIVWPLPLFTMVTKRVVEALQELRVKSYQLENMAQRRNSRLADEFGFSVGALSRFLPEDLAIRYGKPLGLECEPGCWPEVKARPRTQPLVIPHPKSCREDTIDDRDRSFDSCEELLNRIHEYSLNPEDIKPHAPAVLAIWNGVEGKLRPLQQECAPSDWMFEHEYGELRALGALVLDVLGYVSGDEAGTALRTATTLMDPRLKAFAISSLLRRCEAVDRALIEEVAANPEMRMIFWRQLRALGKESLMPEQWADPVQLAASDLCAWASHPNELGVAPTEVEPMMVFSVESEDGVEEDVYLFRFREYPKPWEPSEGWMAGIAGPIRQGESEDSPWSSFTKWNEMSPEEHFDALYYR